LQPTLWGHYLLGLCYFNMGEIEKASRQFKVVIDNKPGFVQARLISAMILIAKNRNNDSISEINNILKIDINNEHIFNFIGTDFLSKGIYISDTTRLNSSTKQVLNLTDIQRRGSFYFNMRNLRGSETGLQSAANARFNTPPLPFFNYINHNDNSKTISLLQDEVKDHAMNTALYNSSEDSISSGINPESAINCQFNGKNGVTQPYATYFRPNVNQFMSVACKEYEYNHGSSTTLHKAQKLESLSANDMHRSYWRN
jgi:hypothetical protein